MTVHIHIVGTDLPGATSPGVASGSRDAAVYRDGRPLCASVRPPRIRWTVR